MSQPPPWYKDRSSSPPFSLVRRIYSNRIDSEHFKSVALFPWTYDSLHTLWNGHHNVSQKDWNAMIDGFSDAIAVGSTNKMYIIHTEISRNPICYKVPISERDLKALSTDCMRVAWTLNPLSPLEPLVLFSYLNLLYIYNIKKEALAGYLRGHGGAITSVAIHPINTNLFCTTSRDYSTRIYDLKLPPQQYPQNPCWPPGTDRSHAGAAHGLHMTEDEGRGIGRCIIVLMGGRSGGHQAAVLGAAFNTDFPIIATCGLDRVIKIWHIPRIFADVLVREDKPLFSSSRIHKARVLSITWLQSDLLLTHSAPALMRQSSDHLNPEYKELWVEPGQLVVWQWLSLSRFFPPGREDIRQDILRGCASDYQESNSFKIISALSFPSMPTQLDAPMMQVHQSPSHDPLVLFTYPKSNVIKLLNVIHLQPRKPQPFPFDDAEFLESTNTAEDGELAPRFQRNIPPEIRAWEITTTTTGAVVESGMDTGMTACAMGTEGATIVGVGIKGTIWIWKTKPSTISPIDNT